MQSGETARHAVSAAPLRSVAGWIAIPVGLVVVIYLWFISAGLWSSWPKTAIFDYYNSLASAFQKGQLYLEDQPSPELLALPDPYRIGARKDVEHIWDATLYKGRYYLYWGPVPALVLVPVRWLFGIQNIPDLYLAFGFVLALFLILSQFLARVWRDYFSGLPPWTLALAIVISGLAPPLTWMLDRPEVYEAALAAAQFFLVCGVYLCYSVIRGSATASARLELASLCLGLAIGCRTSEALPVAFVVLVMLLFFRQKRAAGDAPRPITRSMLFMGAPILVAIVLLLAYNWARFGSALEFGYRYQLTLLQMPKHYDELFSGAYVLPNLYNYFVNPFTIAADFPPIRPQYGRIDLGVGLFVPRIYFSEAVTGLVWTFPFMVCIAGLAVRKRDQRSQAQGSGTTRTTSSFQWLRALILGVLALELAGLLLFFFATERYLVQLAPTLALASSIGFWQVLSAVSSESSRGRWAAAVAILLALASVVSTTLLAISSYQERMRVFNPALFTFLNNLLRR